MDRLMEYLSRIVPKVGHVEAVQSEGYFFLAFGGATAKHVSDGTLRAVALLAALFQPATDEGPSLIGIEEPEAGLHPAAAAILLGAMKERSRSTQVIATSHSPEMLDELRLEEDLLLAVALVDGQTEIGPLDAAGRDIVKRHLYTPGDLLRMEQITPAR
ncbi:MAG: AAA family ATPase [Bryobacteraceae bacterium]|nr:AAA family ATPase [Bryobacteraceae bacterium]